VVALWPAFYPVATGISLRPPHSAQEPS
jgi:hypothetical protein